MHRSGFAVALRYDDSDDIRCTLADDTVHYFENNNHHDCIDVVDYYLRDGNVETIAEEVGTESPNHSFDHNMMEEVEVEGVESCSDRTWSMVLL